MIIKVYDSIKTKGKVALCKCDYCSKKVTMNYSRANKMLHHFCDRECYGNFKEYVENCIVYAISQEIILFMTNLTQDLYVAKSVTANGMIICQADTGVLCRILPGINIQNQEIHIPITRQVD